jgi:very-short-patch-repair endonuclease
MSIAEATMWNLLRVEPLRPFHFRRQVPFDRYFADFASHDLRLIIEVDGSFHTTDAAIEHDAKRDAYLRSRGYRVLRLSAVDVVRDKRAISETLLHACGINMLTGALGLTPPTGFAGPPSPSEGRDGC